MAPDQFWGLTPWQFRMLCEAYEIKQELQHDHDIWMHWHGAYLNRMAKKMAPLADFLAKAIKKRATNAVAAIDEHAIKNRMRAYNKRLQEEKGEP